MYFMNEWFGDKRWWSVLGIRIWAGLFLADAASGMAGKQIFGGVIVFLTVPLIILLVVIYFFYHRKIDTFNKKVDDRLPHFHRERQQWLKNCLQNDHTFLTNCYQCHHVNEETASCSLHLPNRIKMIPMPGYGATTFCLYWNLTDEPLLLQDDKAKR